MLSVNFMRLRLSYEQLDTTRLKEKTDLFLQNMCVVYRFETSPRNIEIPADSPLLKTIADLEQLQRAPQLIRVKASRPGETFSAKTKGPKIIIDLFFGEYGLSHHGKAYFDLISKIFGQDELIAEIIDAVKLKLKESKPNLQLDCEASGTASYQVDFDKRHHLLNLFVGKRGLWPNFDILTNHDDLDNVENELFQVAINTINVYLIKKINELKVSEAEQMDGVLRARYNSRAVLDFILTFKKLFKLFTDFYDQLSKKFGRQLTSNEFDDFVSWFFLQHLNFLLFDSHNLADTYSLTPTHGAELSLRINQIISLLNICEKEFAQLASIGGCFKKWHDMHETLVRNLEHVEKQIKQRHHGQLSRVNSCPNLLTLAGTEKDPKHYHTPPSSPKASYMESHPISSTPLRATHAHKIPLNTPLVVDTRPVSLTIIVFNRYKEVNADKMALEAKATTCLNKIIETLLELGRRETPKVSNELRNNILCLAANIVEIAKLQACLDVCSEHLAAAMPDLQKLDGKITKIRGPNGLEPGTYNRVREQFVSGVLLQRTQFSTEKSRLREVCDRLKNIPPPERLALSQPERLRLQEEDMNVNSLFLDIVQLCDKPNFIQKSCDRVLADLIQSITRYLIEFRYQDDVKQHEFLTAFKALLPEIQDCRQWYKSHHEKSISDSDKLEGATKIGNLHLAVLLRKENHPCLAPLLFTITSARREFMCAAELVLSSEEADKAGDEHGPPKTKMAPRKRPPQVRVSPKDLEPTVNTEKEKEAQDQKLVVLIKRIIQGPYWNHKGYKWWFNFTPRGIEQMRKLINTSLEDYVKIAQERKNVDVGSRRSQLVSDLYNALTSEESFSDKYQRLEEIENFLLNRGDVLPPSPDDIYNLQFECGC